LRSYVRSANHGIWVGIRLRRSGGSPFLLEALAAEYRPALGGLKRHCGLFAALRAIGTGFHFRISTRSGDPQRRCPLPLAGLAAFGLVLELFVVEEELFPGCEYELGTAVYTLQDLVLEFHKAPFNPAPLAFPKAQHVHVAVAESRSDTAEVKVRSLYSTLGRSPGRD